MNKCPACDEEFDDDEYQKHIKSHEEKSILNNLDHYDKIRGQKARFTKRMRKIIQNNMTQGDKMLADDVLYKTVNGKKKRRGDLKWFTLKQQHPKIVKTAWKIYQKDFEDDLGYVTPDNFHDIAILIELATDFLREEATKPKKKKKVGRTTKIEQRLDELEKRVAELEN